MRNMLILAAFLVPVAVLADDGLAVHDAYARVSNPKSGAAFMMIENRGDRDCALVGVASDAAQRVELHTNREEDGVMRMLPLDRLAIPAGGRAALARGGDHVMLMGLHQPLRDGDLLTLGLDFGDCGSATVDIPVDNARTGG